MDTLSVEKITAAYKKDKKSKLILNDITFSLEKGEFVCLCGVNGCGKSTLMSLLCGLNNKNLQILSVQKMPSIGNQEIHKMKRKECAQKIAYMQQNETSMWDFNVFDYVLQGRFCHSSGGYYTSADYEIVQYVLQEMNLEKFASQSVNSLSGGEFQKIRIARALCQEPDFMLLDEPASNIDYVYEPQLMKLLQNLAHTKKTGILVIVHNINIAYNYADRICLLPSCQKMISGNPQDVMTSDNLKLTFGVEFQCKETKCFQLLQ